MNSIGEYERTITVEPTASTRIDFSDEPITIEGKRPPFGLPTWWPWIVAAIAVGGLFYLTREKGRGPLGGGG